MNKKLLAAALLAGLGVAQAASAQTFDDRWYVTAGAGFNNQDNDRGTNSAPFGTVGFGKFLTPNWSLDAELNYQNPTFKGTNNVVNPAIPGPRGSDMNWSQSGISFDLRRHFMTEGRNWDPYVLMGLGYQRHDQQFDAYPSPNSPAHRTGGNVAAKVGAGLQADMGAYGIRAELAYRGDFDNTAVLFRNGSAVSSPSWFGDVLASVGVIIPLGPEPATPVAAPPPPPPAAPSCADQDSDNDGVNNCDDKCPDSQPGQAVGPDGCPVPLTIDLKGVNFDFNKSNLRPDAVEILNQAVEILKRYPELRVQVAGNTDLCGGEAYNQKLSESRAKIVFDFLTSNGIDAGRLIGPIGYGETRPLVETPNTYPACRNETNRRTELNVQNN